MRTEPVQSWEGTMRGELIRVSKDLKEVCQKDGARFCLGVPSNRTRGKGQELMHGKLLLNMGKNFFTVQ